LDVKYVLSVETEPQVDIMEWYPARDAKDSSRDR
jgi:hypothetical protein